MKLKTFSLLSGAVLIFVGVSYVSAQQSSPEFFISWEAQSHVPSWFPGKILPVSGSPISVSFELVDKGKLVDVSQEEVFWYLDDNFFRGGRGLQTISFAAPQIRGGSAELRIQINNYKNEGRIVLQSFLIPVVKQETIIEAALPNNEFSESNIRVFGFPYFFNLNDVADLVFSWSVNGKTPLNPDNEAFLDINTVGAVAGAKLHVSLTVHSERDLFKNALGSLILTKK